MPASRTLLLLASLLTATPSSATEFVPDWAGVTFDPLLPVDPAWVANPVLSWLSIPDLPTRFVADPFLFRGEDRWWLFFELVPPYSSQGVIAVASSLFGAHWEFDRVVLETPEHLSYPLVFRWGEFYYLVPCVLGTDVVRLYRATAAEFPYTWSFASEILRGRHFADPTIFRHADRWWLTVSDISSESLALYSSDDLEDPTHWHEHPASPVVAVDRSRARPAGRVQNLGGRLIRLAQRCDRDYGELVRAFEITTLDEEHYAEVELRESPVLVPGGAPWNAFRMHQLDPWWTGERWLCAVDGYDGQRWSIGIYTDDLSDPTAAAAAAAQPGGLALDCAGWRGGAPLLLRCTCPAAAPATLALYGVSGRRLRSEQLPAGAGSCELRWDPVDGAGRPLPTGLYLLALRAAGHTVQRKVLLLR